MKRRSKQRESIVRVLRGTRSHPTADWVYEQVRKEIPNISLGTVYRNLKMMKERGEILELSCAGSLGRFDGNPENHYHFRCDRCGRVHDIDEAIDRAIDEKVAARTGFEISHHRLEFRGLCIECQVE
ncbi:MAG: transcriptional repressor [Chloroflexi bacterium RBG_13_60_13]|nr:MAG: transcriptional repressor [Chloroflexi bacterium RBG_13_60_13]